MPQVRAEGKAKRTLYVSFFIRAKMGCQSGPQRQFVWCERSAVSQERRNQPLFAVRYALLTAILSPSLGGQAVQVDEALGCLVVEGVGSS